MLSLREKNIAFYLSIVLPIEICLLVVDAMKVGEFKDAKEEHMMDCSYFRTLSNISGFGPHLLRMITEKNYISRLYRHVDADQTSDRIPEKIMRLSRGLPMYHLAYDNADIQRYPGSLLNEGNPTLAENTVSQALLNRIRKDKRYYGFGFGFNVFHNIYNDFINEHINNYNDIIITNNIPIINRSTTYHNYVGHLEEIKKKKKLQRKTLKKNNPPLVQKEFMNKSFRNKCR
jgi:hypothetical protein